MLALQYKLIEFGLCKAFDPSLSRLNVQHRLFPKIKCYGENSENVTFRKSEFAFFFLSTLMNYSNSSGIYGDDNISTDRETKIVAFSTSH